MYLELCRLLRIEEIKEKDRKGFDLEVADKQWEFELKQKFPIIPIKEII